MNEHSQSVVAAILAVHSGRLTPEAAVAALKEPGAVTDSLRKLQGDLPPVVLSDGDGEFIEYPMLDVVQDAEKARRALADLGLPGSVQETLFSIAEQPDGTRLLRDTLETVARTGRRLAGSDIRPARREPGSENPTQAPEEKPLRLTTARFLPNFGVSQERYDVRKEHARGGMGRVLLVRDKAIGRDIAMKEL
ncbi:MAG: hypothetical protein IT463_12230, partial [Planctomycetes bacterium]|nr:hypothetical protein [Planctomycetota bacterium]